MSTNIYIACSCGERDDVDRTYGVEELKVILAAAPEIRALYAKTAEAGIEFKLQLFDTRLASPEFISEHCGSSHILRVEDEYGVVYK